MELDARHCHARKASGDVRVLRLLLIAGAGYAAIALFMYVQQRSLQYLPSRIGTPPEAVGLSGVVERHIATPDGETIIAWEAAAPAGMPVILFFHGNGGELADRAARMAYYRAQGFGALFVSYRGFGGSSGTVSEQGLMTDAVSAYDYLRAQGIASSQILLVGESLGTGVAVQLAAMRSVGAVALEAPFTAAVDVAAARYWWLPVRLLMKDQFRSRDHIGAIRVPLLVQHGDADRVIPMDQGKSLFSMANEPKELVIISGQGHDIIAEQAVWARESEFFKRLPDPEQGGRRQIDPPPLSPA